MLPSVSVMIETEPCSPIENFGRTIEPPAADTRASSTEQSSHVHGCQFGVEHRLVERLCPFDVVDVDIKPSDFPHERVPSVGVKTVCLRRTTEAEGAHEGL
jgi:hypothetical protein